MFSEAQWYLKYRRMQHIMKKNRAAGNRTIYMFLDFDGVINVFCLEGTPEYEEIISKGTFDFVRPYCIEHLNAFLRDYDVRFVISSSWRYAGADYCMDYLRSHGLDPSVTLDGMTEIDIDKPRDEEIINYLMDKDDYAGIIIFDDGRMPHLNEYLVLTHPLIGWDEEADIRAREIADSFM